MSVVFSAMGSATYQNQEIGNKDAWITNVSSGDAQGASAINHGFCCKELLFHGFASDTNHSHQSTAKEEQGGGEGDSFYYVITANKLNNEVRTFN